MKKKLELPRFRSEKEERRFWSKTDLSDYFDPSDFIPASFPNLKPSSKKVSLQRFHFWYNWIPKVESLYQGVPDASTDPDKRSGAKQPERKKDRPL